MVLKQGPNKHIIGCQKIQNFQFVVGELQEEFLKAKQIEC
jgi:ssDNA-binding Zn-finger/Zn-ribbon topoisomerase 1